MAAAARASGTGGGSPRRFTSLRTSFAIWEDSAPANGDNALLTGSGSLSPHAAGASGAVLRSPRAPVDDNGAVDSCAAEGMAIGGNRSSVSRRKNSGEEMFARGLVIQPSSKLFGLMEIHDRGSTAG